MRNQKAQGESQKSPKPAFKGWVIATSMDRPAECAQWWWFKEDFIELTRLHSFSRQSWEKLEKGSRGSIVCPGATLTAKSDGEVVEFYEAGHNASHTFYWGELKDGRIVTRSVEWTPWDDFDYETGEYIPFEELEFPDGVLFSDCWVYPLDNGPSYMGHH